MNISDILSICSMLNKYFNKNEVFVSILENHLKNRKNWFSKMFIMNFFASIIAILYIVLLYNKGFLGEIFLNKNVENIIFAIISALGTLSILFFLNKAIEINKYFNWTILKIKKNVNKKNVKNLFLDTKKALKKYIGERLKDYFIECLLPIIAIILFAIYFITIEYQLSSLILVGLNIFAVSYWTSKNFERNHNYDFIIINVFDELPKEKIKGRDVRCIENKYYYISYENQSVIYFDFKYIEIECKLSNFYKYEMKVIECHAEEYLQIILGMLNKKNISPKDRKKLENIKKYFEDTLARLKKVT